MTERLLWVEAEPSDGAIYRRMWLGKASEVIVDLDPDAIAAKLGRLYAAAEANQAPGPDWKAKLRQEVKRLGPTYVKNAWTDSVIDNVLALIDALPDPPTPDPDAPPGVRAPGRAVGPVEGKDVPDGWEGRCITDGERWSHADTCRRYPTMLYEVRRVPVPEPATEPVDADRIQWTEVRPGITVPLLDGLYDMSVYFSPEVLAERER